MQEKEGENMPERRQPGSEGNSDIVVRRRVETAAPAKGQSAPKKQDLDLPAEISKIKQQLQGAKDQFNQIRSQLGAMKNLLKAQEKQQQDILDLQEKQEEILNSLGKVYEVLNGVLGKSTPEADLGNNGIRERLERMDKELDILREAVEKIETHLGSGE